MNKYKIILITFFFLSNFKVTFAQSGTKITSADFQSLIGNWTGSLTYLDYSSGKPYTMPADLKVQQIENSNDFLFFNSYPDEPKANSSDTLRISADGKRIDKETLLSKKQLKSGDLEVVAELKGIDGNDNKPAIIRISYTFGKRIYTHRKEVQFDGTDKWILRHEYSYTRR